MITSESSPSHEGQTEDIAHPIVAAVYDWVVPERFLLRPQRRYLTKGLSGRVLDLGAGTGANFPYVADRSRSALEYHAIEPDPHMRRRASEKAAAVGATVHLRDARAESLPYPDDSFDGVIASLVFCTIQDPDTALDEVVRVLRPGGELRFLEHVHADGWRAAGQDLLTPLWKRVGGGCHLNRETVERLVCHDAFTVEELERLEIGLFPAAPIVRGTLRRRREGLL